MAKNNNNTQEKEIKEEIKPPNTELSQFVENVLIAATDKSQSKFIYDEKTGKVNWFKMIPSEYLYLNESKKASIEKRLGKTFSEVTKEEALETELIINLAGIRFLLDKIGYKYSKITINSCNLDYVAATCEICFNPGEYNNNQEQIYTACASAHPGNTKSWYKQYLVEAASNRALCRAVRFYCNLSCVSAEELGANVGNNVDEGDNYQQNDDIPTQKLQEVMDKFKITFEQLKNKMIQEKIEGAADFKSVRDIPSPIKFSYITRIKSKFEENAK